VVQVFSVEPYLPHIQLSSLPLCYVEICNWSLAGRENRCEGENLHCTSLKHLGRGTLNPGSLKASIKRCTIYKNPLHKSYVYFRFPSKAFLCPYSIPTERDSPYREPSFTTCQVPSKRTPFQDTNGASTETPAPLHAFVSISFSVTSKGSQPNSPPTRSFDR